MKLSIAQVDVTFNAWWRVFGQRQDTIARALTRTKEQIGPPMPAGYVPPPLRTVPKQSLEDMARNNPSLSFLVWEPTATTPAAPAPAKMVSRIVFQRFERFECSNTGAQSGPPDDGRKHFKTLIDGAARAISGGKRAFVWGTEDKGARRTQMVPESHVIIDVHIKKGGSYHLSGFAECDSASLEATYTWGPYKPSIGVTEITENSALGETHRWKRKYTKPRDQVAPEYLPDQ